MVIMQYLCSSWLSAGIPSFFCGGGCEWVLGLQVLGLQCGPSPAHIIGLVCELPAWGRAPESWKNQIKTKESTSCWLTIHLERNMAKLHCVDFAECGVTLIFVRAVLVRPESSRAVALFNTRGLCRAIFWNPDFSRQAECAGEGVLCFIRREFSDFFFWWKY